MPDMFSYKRSPKPHAVFSNEDSLLIFGGVNTSSDLGYLVQEWNVNYRQDVQEIFELGSNALYWVKGRPVGGGTISRMVGARAADTASKGFFPADAYDICKGGVMMTLQATGGHCDTPPLTPGGVVADQGVTIIMDGCLVSSVGFNSSVRDTFIQEAFGWRFAYMDVQA